MVEKYKRNSVMIEFNDHLSDGQWCELTEWHNGEGFDVAFEGKTIGLTHAEFHNLCGLGSIMLGTYEKGE